MELLKLNSEEERLTDSLSLASRLWSEDMITAEVAVVGKRSEVSSDYWGCVPQRDNNTIPMILRAIKTVKADKQPNYKPTFVDVGSGSGIVSKFAHILGAESYGLEIDETFKPYGEVNEHIYDPESGSIITKKIIDVRFDDATTIEDEYYSNFDIVYFYRPVAEHELLVELIIKVIDNMKSDSYLIIKDCQNEIIEALTKTKTALISLDNGLDVMFYKPTMVTEDLN